MTDEVLTFDECCARLRMSPRTGRRLLADGQFPIPALPTLRGRRTYSTADLQRYLDRAATERRPLRAVRRA